LRKDKSGRQVLFGSYGRYWKVQEQVGSRRPKPVLTRVIELGLTCARLDGPPHPHKWGTCEIVLSLSTTLAGRCRSVWLLYSNIPDGRAHLNDDGCYVTTQENGDGSLCGWANLQKKKKKKKKKKEKKERVQGLALGVVEPPQNDGDIIFVFSQNLSIICDTN
jgi:hypothetical protein